MKYYTLILTLLITLSSSADQEGKISNCSNGNCFSATLTGNLTEKEVRAFLASIGTAKVTQGATQITKIINDMTASVDRVCSKFVKDNEFQKWGEFVSQEFDRGKYSALYAGTPDLLRLCPNFKKMTDDQKDSVFILTTTLQAYFESSCNPNASFSGAPNGTARGLFQQHEGKEHLYSRGCKAGDSRNPEGSIRCTLSMLDDIAAKGKNIFTHDSHWAVHRPQDRNIKAGFRNNAAISTMLALCKIPSCGAEPTECTQFIKETRDNAIALSQGGQRRSGRVANR